MNWLSWICLYQTGSDGTSSFHPSQCEGTHFPHVCVFPLNRMKPNAFKNHKDFTKYFIQVSVCAILAYFPLHFRGKRSDLLLTMISPLSYIIHGAILHSACTRSSSSQPHCCSVWSLWKEIQIFSFVCVYKTKEQKWDLHGFSDF